MLVRTFFGLGYPSASRELVKIRYGNNDPNGYYLILGLDPQCTMSEIKYKYRELTKKYHPDGYEPNIDKFREIKEIYNTLIDHNKRTEYNNIPENSNLFFLGPLEKEKIREEAQKRHIAWDKLVQSPETDKNKIKCNEESDLYTYTADIPERAAVAQQWYQNLLPVAYLFNYGGPLRVAVCPLDKLCKITNFANYLIFWFDSALEPNWAIAFLAFSLFKKTSPLAY